MSTLSDGGWAAKVAAANALLDRGWGKAEQAVVGPGENGEHIFTLIERRIVKSGN